jgi:hypothetical protein
MIMGEYQFRGTLRMPTNVDASAVVSGTKAVQADLGNHKIIVPPSYSGLGPHDQRSLYVRAIQEHGHWSTSGDGKTALLYDEQGTPVYEGGPIKFDVTKGEGLQAPGNLNPWQRPSMHNPDGSYSTTSSMSVGSDKGEVLIPTVVNGKRLSHDEAIAHYKKTGENFGTFDTPAHADKYATALHNAQAKMYDKSGTMLRRQVALDWKTCRSWAADMISCRRLQRRRIQPRTLCSRSNMPINPVMNGGPQAPLEGDTDSSFTGFRFATRAAADRSLGYTAISKVQGELAGGPMVSQKDAIAALKAENYDVDGIPTEGMSQGALQARMSRASDIRQSENIAARSGIGNHDADRRGLRRHVGRSGERRGRTARRYRWRSARRLGWSCCDRRC